MTSFVAETTALLARTPEVLRALLIGLPEGWTDTPDAADGWRPRDVVGHLITGEQTDWILRMRRILEEGTSREFDRFERFAMLERDAGVPLDDLVERFATLRTANLAALAELVTDADLDRRGLHPSLGEVTLRELLATWAVHDLDHIGQIYAGLAGSHDAEVGPWKQYLGILLRREDPSAVPGQHGVPRSPGDLRPVTTGRSAGPAQTTYQGLARPVAHFGGYVRPFDRQGPNADARAADGDGHLPLHRCRGFDQAPARARRARVCRGAGGASAHRAAGVRRSRRRRGRHPGRRVLRRVPDRAGCCRSRARDDREPRSWPDSGAHRPAHRHAAPDRRGLRRGRRPPGGADRRLGPWRPGARLGLDRGARRSRSPRSGEHRFKDLAAPERVYQLGDVEFPSLKSLYRTNLPVPATPFLGREGELAKVVELLTREGTRLLTLTGPGGTGKTRLALQAAAEASDRYPGGVFWVALASLRDHRLVLLLAQVLEVSEQPGRELMDTLASHLAAKRLLLVLDNTEHLLPELASTLAALAGACPTLRLLVTSRESLQVAVEIEYPVPTLEPADGVALFRQRAAAHGVEVAPSPAVEELCARLDELPLALELAAARTKLFSPEQLLERISQRLDLLKAGRDADPRQQTLRATIEWSHDLLNDGERQLFRRLSVFAGGCTYEAAEDVAGGDPDTLQSLLDKNLVRRRDSDHAPRYWMLETIREYAAERLGESGEAEDLRRRHAEYFVALAEEAEPHLRKDSEESREWLDRLDPEHDNVRAALDELDTSGEGELVLRLAGAVWWFWDARNLLVEGRRRLESALRADGRPTAGRARALNGAGEMAMNAGDVAAAQPCAEEALALHRALGDAWGTAFSAYLLGHANLDLGDVAQPLLEESARLFKELDDQLHYHFAIHLLAWTSFRHGDGSRARTLWEENLERSRAAGDRHIEALTLGALADNVVLEEGRVDDALSMLMDAYRIHRDLRGPAVQTAMDMARLARGLARGGRAAAAARVLASAEALYEEIGAHARPINAQIDEATIATIRVLLDDSAFAEAWERGRALSPDEAVALAGESEI